MNEWSLMKYVRGGGCASKIGPGDLSGILCDMKAPRDENVLAGFDDFEDTGNRVQAFRERIEAR